MAQSLKYETTYRAFNLPVYKALGSDLLEYAFPSAKETDWALLGPIYQRAWLDETKRRLRGHELDLLNDKRFRDIVEYLIKLPFKAGGLLPSGLLFSQVKCNDTFQSHYDGSPEWIASSSLDMVAKKLLLTPAKSIDFRISVSLHAGRWVVWNNRGFTAHCLANITPLRIAPKPSPTADELSRMGETVDGLNYRDSLPARRTPHSTDRAAPCSLISIVRGDSPLVRYTVKSGFLMENSLLLNLGTGDALDEQARARLVTFANYIHRA